MARVEKTIDVEVPVRTAYNQWTQFEDFPEFMEGVHEVNQLDDTHLHWRAKVGGHEKEWDAVIREQVPDEKIIWTSTDGAENAGIVQFSSMGPSMTRVHLEMSYDPEGFTEHVGDVLGFASRRISGDLQRFKDFIEARGVETGGYRDMHENPDVPGGHTRGQTGAEDDGTARRGTGGASTISNRMEGQMERAEHRGEGGAGIRDGVTRADRPGAKGAGMDFGPDDYPEERGRIGGGGIAGTATDRPSSFGTTSSNLDAPSSGTLTPGAARQPGLGSDRPENVETLARGDSLPTGGAPVPGTAQLQTPGALQPGSLSREEHQRVGNGPGWTADASTSGQADAPSGSMTTPADEPAGDMEPRDRA